MLQPLRSKPQPAGRSVLFRAYSSARSASLAATVMDIAGGM